MQYLLAMSLPDFHPCSKCPSTPHWLPEPLGYTSFSHILRTLYSLPSAWNALSICLTYYPEDSSFTIQF